MIERMASYDEVYGEDEPKGPTPGPSSELPRRLGNPFRAERIASSERPEDSQSKTTLLRELRVTRADEITPTRIRWLWPCYLPAGRLTLGGGKPADGKSSVTTDLAARFSTGSRMPDGHQPSEPINCGILSAEDGASDTIIPRLIVAGADLKRVFIVNGIVDDIGIERPWILPDDLLELIEFVREHDIRLLIVDPLSAFQSAKVDTHRDGAVRGMLHPLSNMAQSLDCAVLAVRHHRKGGAADARDAGSGSIAFTAAARLEWAFGTDPSDGARRILAVSKSNIGPTPPSMVYRLQQDDEWSTNRVVWDGQSEVTANQLVGEQPTDEERSELDEAIEFLRTELSDGPLAAKVVKRRAGDADISERTLRRAKDRLRIKSRKTNDGSWIWELRKQGGQATNQGGQTDSRSHLGHVGPLGHLPYSESVCKEGFTREDEQGGQGGQGAVSQGMWPPSDDPRLAS